MAFTYLPWNGWLDGFETSIATTYLTDYLSGNAWLSSEHINQMLDIVQREVLRGGGVQVVEILDCEFVESVKAAANNCMTYEGGNKQYAWLRRVGETFASGKRSFLGTVVNVFNSHWVCLAVDFANTTILYGDSFGHEMGDTLKETMMWWTYHHTKKQFRLHPLPITPQKDSYNCGVLAWNALAHLVLPDRYHLLESREVASERLRIAARVIERHNDYVSWLLRLTRKC
ncbi:hypothetical protein K474DRAFT_1607112 [Panus rudis PR-1116 ss-1]|nr:hypothetical protein K474DRAFT_1607112 [Panus rudis PR-1116 ss-1]